MARGGIVRLLVFVLVCQTIQIALDVVAPDSGTGLFIFALLLGAFMIYLGWTQELFGKQQIYRSNWMWAAPAVVLMPVVLRLGGVEWIEVPGAQILTAFQVYMLIAAVEELVYRGFAVRMLRSGGHAEAVVAAVSSLLFGLSHFVRLRGPESFEHVRYVALFAFGFGVLMYLSMRAFGYLVAAIVLHGAAGWAILLAHFAQTDVSSPIASADLLAAADHSVPLTIGLAVPMLLMIRGHVEVGGRNVAGSASSTMPGDHPAE